MKPGNASGTSTILFRTDATPATGTGHLMRCMALAEICMEMGHQAIFAMAECPQVLQLRLTTNKMVTRRLYSATAGAELITLIEELQPKGIVIDGYQFDESYRKELYHLGIPILTMDDGNIHHPLHAHIVVNSSPLASAADYKTIAPEAHLLLGPSYAPLRREFRHSDPLIATAPLPPRILVTFGGSDPLALTALTMASLLQALSEDIVFDVVIGGAVTDDIEIERLAQVHAHRIQLHKNTSTMATLMHQASLAIAAAGSTLWELAYLAVPTIAVVVADNQEVMLKPPLNHWFSTIDARNDRIHAVEQVAAASHSMWVDKSSREHQRDVLREIKVGEEAAAICKAFDEVYRKAS